MFLKKKDFVRAWSYKTGYIIRVDKTDTKSCNLIYYTHTDLRGWIPDKLINKALRTFAPRLVDKMIVVVPDYIKWREGNSKPLSTLPPDHKKEDQSPNLTNSTENPQQNNHQIQTNQNTTDPSFLNNNPT